MTKTTHVSLNFEKPHFLDEKPSVPAVCMKYQPTLLRAPGAHYKYVSTRPFYQLTPPLSTRINSAGGAMVRRWRCGNLRLLEILRFSIAISIGFCIRMLTEPHWNSKSALSGCKECMDCSANMEELLQAGVHQQLREPFQPKNRHEVLRYQYFNSSLIFDTFDESPKSTLMGHQRSDITNILSQSMALFNSGKSRPWRMKRLVNGYRRVDPLRGEEYILDLEMQTNFGDDPKDKTTLVTEVHRIQTVKPFGTAHMLGSHLFIDNKMIHFILPLSTSINDRFERFLSNYEEVCLRPKEHVYLMIILFAGKSPVDHARADSIRNKMHKLHQRYRGSHIRVIQTNKAYNRILGLDLGIKQLPAEAHMFFCDVDIRFSPDFLNRCRHNSVQGSQVYYPIVFAQYNPRIIKKYSPPGEVKSLLTISEHTGRWLHSGYSIACMYNLDYRVVGGFGVDHEGLGGEDVDLFNKHVERNFNVFRAMDPGLLHIYHNNSCSINLSEDHSRMCHESLAKGHGSHSQLAMKLLDEEGGW